MVWRNARRLYCRESRDAEVTSYATQLQQCTKSKDITRGRRIHSELQNLGYDKHTFLGTLLVQMYGQSGCLDEAILCFQNIRNPIIFSHNVMVAAYAHNGHLHQAKKMFDGMEEKDVVSWNGIVSAYSHSGDLQSAKSLFDDMPLKNIISYNTMITAYAQTGDLSAARRIFDSMNLRDTATWNAMITGYNHKGLVEEAKALFDRMPRKNLITWNATVTGYAQHGHLETASRMFSRMPEWSEICWNVMISGFSHNKRLADAWRLFVKLPFRGMVSWIAMLQGWIKNGHLHEAWSIFRRMPQTDVITWTGIFTAFANQGYLQEAESLFEAMPERDTTAVNAMIASYGLHGHVEKARILFEGMTKRDVISWNGLISAYAQNGHANQAIGLFRSMDLEGVHPDCITFVGALDACALLSAVEFGRLVHDEVISSKVHVEAGLATALVNLYGKCGRLETGRELFDNMSFCDVILLNAMLAAYAQNGEGDQALELFNQLTLTGVEPDSITFISVMGACSHGGLLRDGYFYFLLLTGDFGLAPNVEHYSCMVDLLGRTGQLKDAEELLISMPFEPEYSAWRSLLSACQSYGDVKRGTHVAKLAARNNPGCSSPYVILSRIYNAAGRHGEGSSVRRDMNVKGLKKPAGLSCITIKGKVHEFIAGGKCHPEIEAILKELGRLKVLMREAGYVADTSTVLHDFEEEDKEHALSFHSEKLAIAFGILKTAKESPLHVVKNLRICSDCHAAAKFISRITRRRITVRDAHRFHHFQNGACTCCDFW